MLNYRGDEVSVTTSMVLCPVAKGSRNQDVTIWKQWAKIIIRQSEHGAEIAGEFLVDEIYVLKLEYNQDHAVTFKYYIFMCMFDIYKLPFILSKYFNNNKKRHHLPFAVKSKQ